MSYQFTTSWFLDSAKNNWDQLMPQLRPTKILEIGSFEGASTCYLVEMMRDAQSVEIHCLDTWEGGIEHKGVDMLSVEQRFDSNIAHVKSMVNNLVEVKKYKDYSDITLPKLLAEGYSGYFDFIYVDGSHQAPDVLFDACLAFKLLRVGGLIAFDDYLWSEDLPGGRDLTRCPKPAIDAFTSLYWNKINIINAPLWQIYVTKKSN
jgi:predicted O-methyltransferase YrrM